MLLKIFATPVLIDTVDLAKIEIKNINFSQKWQGDVHTSHGYFNELNKEGADELLKVITKNLNEIISFRYQLEIQNVWQNKYEIGHSQDKHMHTRAHFSFIVYENVDEGKTVFVHPINDFLMEKYAYLGIQGDEAEQIFQMSFEPKLKKGSIIIFPSYLEHYVRKNTKSGSTISGNIKITAIDNSYISQEKI
jgi:hypothetical protein